MPDYVSHNTWKTILTLIIIFILVSCESRDIQNVSPNNPTLTPSFFPTTMDLSQITATLPLTNTSTQSPPTPTPSFTPTSLQTTTPTVTPSLTNSPSITPSETPVPADFIPPNALFIYFSLPGENYPDECQYVLVDLYIGILRTGDLEKDISTALDRLFTAGQYSGNLYNATYTSNLHTDRVEVIKSSGKVNITLSGSYVKPDNACDAQQYRNQVWTTVRQFPEVGKVVIQLDNGQLLGDLLAVYSDR